MYFKFVQALVAFLAVYSLSVSAQYQTCLDSSSAVVSLTYSMNDYARILVQPSQAPSSPSNCYLQVKNSSNSVITQAPVTTNALCSTPFLLDMSAPSSPQFEYDTAYSVQLIGVDGQGQIICTSQSLTISISAPQVLSMFPGMFRLDGESISFSFSPAIPSGICEVILELYNGQPLSPAPRKLGPCTSVFTFKSDNMLVAMQPGDSVGISWGYYEDGITSSYSSSAIDMGSIGPSFYCSQPLKHLRTQRGISYIAITNPVPSQGTCSLVVDSCTSSGYIQEIPFSACHQYASVSLESLSLSDSPVSCTFHWRYEYNQVTCEDPTVSFSITMHEQCIISSFPVTVSNSFSVIFQFQSSNLMDCIARLWSCGTTIYDPPLEKTVANCVSSSSTVTFDTNDSNAITDGVFCNVDFVRVPSGAPSSTPAYSCQSDTVSVQVGPPPSDWPNTASVQIVYKSDSCVLVSWNEYTMDDRVLCYQVDRRFDTSVSNEWTILNQCLKAISLLDCVSADLQNISYRVRAFSVTVDKWTNFIQSSSFSLSDFLFPASPLLVSPTFDPSPTDNVFESQSFPTLIITSGDSSIHHLFVAKLGPRSKIDPNSGDTLVTPLVQGDSGYIAQTQPLLTSMVFTNTFQPDLSEPGTYVMTPTSLFGEPAGFVPQGNYSLMVYQLAPSGLVVQYYADPMFALLVHTEWGGLSVQFEGPYESPVVQWPFAQLNYYEHMSIRYTGFLEPKFAEKTIFTIESFGYFCMWLDDVVIIDQLTTPCVSGSCSSLPIQLRTSPWVPHRSSVPGSSPATGMKLFHSIRIDYMVMSDLDTVPTIPGIVLKWSSRSLPIETVPLSSLYYAKIFPSSFPLIKVRPGLVDLSHSIIIGMIGPISVGQAGMVYVQTRDSLGQDTDTNCFDVFTATFTLISDPSYTLTSDSFNAGGVFSSGLYEIPITFSAVGSYRVTVVDSNTNTPVSGTSGDVVVVVVAAQATQIIGPLSFGPSDTVVALTETRVYFALKDANGFDLDDQSLLGSILPEIDIAGDWLYDPQSVTRLGGAEFTDDVSRSRLVNTVSPTINWEPVLNKFYGTINFAASGIVRVSVRIAGITDSLVQEEITIVGNVDSFEPNQSVVVPTPRPTSWSVEAGAQITFNIQLRDSNGNPLEAFPVPSPYVFVEVYQSEEPRILDSSPCTPSAITLGVMDCVGNFFVTGDNLWVNITVNGQPTLLFENQQTNPGEVSEGPFPITVTPSTMDPSLTVWSNVPRAITKNVPHETVFTFFDVYGNEFGEEAENFSDILVEFVDAASTVVYSESVVFFEEGKLRLNLNCPVASSNDATDPDYTGFLVQLSVSGSVVVPFGSPMYIRVIRGGAEASDITCSTNFASQVTAGSAVTMTCVGGGLEGPDTEYLTFIFDSVQTPLALVSASAGYTASYGPTMQGTYSLQTVLKQRGGLEARYCVDDGFTSIISPSPRGIESSYTRVDSTLDFTFGDNIEIDHVVAKSVEWRGYIDPPSTSQVRFHLQASGTVQLILGGSIMYDSLHETTDSIIDADLVTSVVAGEPLPIVIKYVPRDGAARFALNWIYPNTSGETFPIPPRVLLRDVIVASSVINEFSVVASIISSNSRVGISTTALANQVFTFLIDAVDAYGNDLDAPSTCLGSGTFPDCLFHVETTPSAALVSGPSVTHVSGGQYSVDVTLDGASSQVLFSVQLALAGGIYEDLTGSPFTFNVINI